MPSSPLHAVTWLTWAVAAAAAVEIAPSPLYVVLVVVVAAVVVEAHGRDTALSRAFPTMLGVGVAFIVLRVVLTAATTHGIGRAVLTLPDATLPRILGGFTVGGSVEWEVVLQAAAEGAAVIGVLAAFGAFNAVVSHHELLSSAPRAFHEPGLVVTVALAFVPSTVLAIRAVREADRARTGLRSPSRGRLRRRALPVLETGMERAVALAESMDSRGFARGRAGGAERASAWCGLAGLLALGAAFVALVSRTRPIAVALGIAGCVAVGAAVALASAGTATTRYRPRSLTAVDRRVAVACLAAPLALGALATLGADSLRWTAVPLRVPTFDLRAAAAIALLLAPAMVRRP